MNADISILILGYYPFPAKLYRLFWKLRTVKFGHFGRRHAALLEARSTFAFGVSEDATREKAVA
jgi:hypothetical protein